METFDFFAVYNRQKVSCLGALRVISDICGDRLGVITRAVVSFKKAARIILSLVALKQGLRTRPSIIRTGLNGVVLAVEVEIGFRSCATTTFEDKCL